jgi:hypothetical protein
MEENNKLPTQFLLLYIFVTIRNNATQNISKARVDTQLAVLNRDFAGIGLNSGTLPAPFAAVKANTNITFCAAKLDLNNNILAEPGIERINAQTRGWGNPEQQPDGQEIL